LIYVCLKVNFEFWTSERVVRRVHAVANHKMFSFHLNQTIVWFKNIPCDKKSNPSKWDRFQNLNGSLWNTGYSMSVSIKKSVFIIEIKAEEFNKSVPIILIYYFNWLSVFYLRKLQHLSSFSLLSQIKFRSSITSKVFTKLTFDKYLLASKLMHCLLLLLKCLQKAGNH